MGTHLCSTINRQTSQVGPPEDAQNILKHTVLEISWSLIGAESRTRQKNGPAQVDAKELPRRSQKTLISNHLFANSVLRNPLSGRSRYALHFENNKKGIGCINIVDVLTGAMVDLPKEHPKSKTSTMLQTLRRKTERAPRCMGMLFVFLWSGWMPPRRSPKNAPDSYF